ncbi:MAG: dihydrofolate reductase [Acidobacteriota bacterium]
MITSLIVAMDRKRGIGIDNHLPWRLSADLKRFRTLTMGHHLIVGRKTFTSIGKALPGRTMIVLTRDLDFQAPGCFIAHSFEDAIEMVRARDESEVFVGGGSDIYRVALPLADRIYLTLVEAEIKADTFFPELNEVEWIEETIASHPADDRNVLPFTFKVLTRK